MNNLLHRFLRVLLINALAFLIQPLYAQACNANFGNLAEAAVCINDDQAVISTAVLAQSGEHIPNNFERLFVLTSGTQLIIEAVNATPEFLVTTDADYRIHSLIYDPSSLDLSAIVFGQTSAVTVNSLLVQGGGDICAALDVTGVLFRFGGCGNSCLADAGTVVPSDDVVCLPVSVLEAEIQDAPIVPSGFSVIYVLTRTNSLIIEGVSATPSFTVLEAGNYRIHTLVYDPQTLDLGIVEFGVTTGFDVNGLLQQGGGDICAALDVAGAAFSVEDCEEECKAAFSTLIPLGNDCLDHNGSVLLRTLVVGLPTVPAGFEVLYVLTSGDELVIEAVNNLPFFTVEETGRFTIHTLVYDPQTLDLGIVQFGVTTGFDVNGLLQQGGGDICAVLDVTGAHFNVSACEDCEADFGHIYALSNECLDGSVELEATVQFPPTIPAGFEVLYVLTSGSELVIEAVNNLPFFTVDETGRFTIHTLVYDPQTLDLGIVQFGVTTGFDVNGLLQQGGGDICAVLDVTGAQFNVSACEECAADFGHIYASSHECLDGSVELEATVQFPPTIPAGFELLYVLTSGDELIIEAVSDSPEFTVDETGRFTIHTLVYDPQTLDLGIVEFGVTTGFDVNGLLLQGGGDICAALDVAGAAFDVEDCEQACKAAFSSLIPLGHDCLDKNGSVLLRTIVVGLPTVPAGYEVLYVLTSGSELVIEAVNNLPFFTVEEPGRFTIHTLVYDPQTLDLGIVQFGVTTGFDINGLLQQGGGDICAALDVTGAAFDVEDCTSLSREGIFFPNPVQDILQIQTPEIYLEQGMRISIHSTNGQLSKELLFEAPQTLESINMSNMPAGKYMLVIKGLRSGSQTTQILKL